MSFARHSATMPRIRIPNSIKILDMMTSSSSSYTHIDRPNNVKSEYVCIRLRFVPNHIICEHLLQNRLTTFYAIPYRRIQLFHIFFDLGLMFVALFLPYLPLQNNQLCIVSVSTAS